MHEVGPHAPDGRYARVAFDLERPFGKGEGTPLWPRAGRTAGLSFEWSRHETAVVARVRAEFTGTLEVLASFPWDWRGVWSTDGASLLARSSDEGVAFALHPVTENARVHQLRAGTSRAAVRFDVGPGAVVYLGAALARDPAAALGLARGGLTPAAVDAALDVAADAYEASLVSVDGHWDGLAASITNNLHGMVLLQPETGERYVPAGRSWVLPSPHGRDHWTVFFWHSFFNALELAVESPELAKDALRAVLRAQYENGNVPNWRGRFGGTPDRSQPPVGAVTLAPAGFFVAMDGRPLLRTDGPVVLRHVDVGDGRLSARAHARQPVTVALDGPGPWSIELDGHAVDTSDGTFTVPAGEHAVRARAGPPDR